MHLWLSVNSIVIWSLLLMCLFGCDLCLGQSDSCSTYNCEAEAASLQVSPAVDAISSSSSSSSSSSPSSSSSSSPSSSSSLPPEETFSVMNTSSSLALFSPFDDTSSSLFYPSSSSSFTSGDFIPIAPRSVASTRRRKSKYLSKSSKKSRFIDPRNTLECHRREYTFKATNTDAKGRLCWQFVTAMSCWGRCHSGEIPDWAFPFKKSFHPVCTHDKTQLRTVKLRYCDEGVDESLSIFRFTEAVSCSCKVCHSSTASCQGLLNLRSHGL